MSPFAESTGKNNHITSGLLPGEEPEAMRANWANSIAASADIVALILGEEESRSYWDAEEALSLKVTGKPLEFKPEIKHHDPSEVVELLSRILAMPEDLAGQLVLAALANKRFRVTARTVFEAVDPQKPSVRPRHYEDFRQG